VGEDVCCTVTHEKRDGNLKGNVRRISLTSEGKAVEGQLVCRAWLTSISVKHQERSDCLQQDASHSRAFQNQSFQQSFVQVLGESRAK
jgi:hypothetical protein